jgi:NAD(P) transhydrogenase
MAYDLVVIGSGPAGEKGAAQAAYFGKRVALVDKAPVLGGAAANTGTLPSKTLRETALYLSGFRQRGLYGVTFTLRDKVTARDFLHRERDVVHAEHARIARNLSRHGVDVHRGQAAFHDAHTIVVQTTDGAPVRLETSVVLVATGSHPFRAQVFPFDDPRVFDSDTILQIHDIPGTMLVAGGGVIGCEYACLFAALGVKVTLIDSKDRLLGFMDAQVSRALAASMTKMGIDVRFHETVESVDAGETLRVRLGSGTVIRTGAVLAATGRTGNTSGLGLEAIGLKPTSRGMLEVNEHYQTAVPTVYAAGDVIGFPALASTSMEQARVAMVHAFDLKYKTAVASILPYGIYTIPECSMAGETEESLAAKGIPFVAGVAAFSQNARGQIIGDDDGFLKLLFRHDDMALVGVHVFGEQASELVHVGLLALLVGAGAEIFIQMCQNYPTLSELYKYATYDAMGRRAGRSLIGVS